MIRIAIVEDDISSSQRIKEYIENYFQQTSEEFNLIMFDDGKQIVFDYKPIYDIIFLDIQMKHMDGISTAKHIRKLDDHVIVVFITNMASYAIQGYAVDALSFLLKPVSYNMLSQQLKRSIDNITKKRSNYLLITTEDGIVRMNVDEVMYIESMGHKIIIHSKLTDYTTSGTIKAFESQLHNKNFFRCNNSYLVNMRWVTMVNNNFITVGNHNLQISRPKKKAFMMALTAYYGGNII